MKTSTLFLFAALTVPAALSLVGVAAGLRHIKVTDGPTLPGEPVVSPENGPNSPEDSDAAGKMDFDLAKPSGGTL